jgi:dTDP-4-dehydrorhamnose reductase
VNTGHSTWYEVAQEIARQLAVQAALEPISVADVKLRAVRPRYCALANDKLRAAGISMPTWQEALTRAIAERSLAAERN